MHIQNHPHIKIYTFLQRQIEILGKKDLGTKKAVVSIN